MKNLKATSLKTILIFLILLIIAISSVGFYFVFNKIEKSAAEVKAKHSSTLDLNNNTETSEIRKYLTDNSDNINKLSKSFHSKELANNIISNTISKYAEIANTPGVSVLFDEVAIENQSEIRSAKITFSDKINYSNFIKFLDLIERTSPIVSISSLDIISSSKDTVTINSLSINYLVK